MVFRRERTLQVKMDMEDFLEEVRLGSTTRRGEEDSRQEAVTVSALASPEAV